ncbi:MAG: hypothetical protein U9Q69_05225 [Nanoarchaeota archaeon]|nr:hypothetical protein [Nanoarchaeota archaeon]
MGTAIEKKLAEAGYSMLGDNEDIEKLILNILETGNIRYLKAIPFLIYKHDINIRIIYKAGMNVMILFSAIMIITKRIFQELDIKKNIPEYLPIETKKIEACMKKRLMNYKEFKQEFELQLRNETKPSSLIDKQKIYAERDLQMYLSRLFTKKEKQIIRRLLEGKSISRTDYEYYSRKTKKKLNSIIGLQDFAKTLYAKTPKCDEDLYHLKKKLEKWLENNSQDKDISIQNFFLWEDDKVSIDYKKKDKRYSEDQSFNTIRKINEIKDKELLNLLHKYKKHNFK